MGATTGGDGGSVPVPSWKLYENPFYDGIAAAVVAAVAIAGKHGENMPYEHDNREQDDSSLECISVGAEDLSYSSSPPPDGGIPTTEHRSAQKITCERNSQRKAGPYEAPLAGRCSVRSAHGGRPASRSIASPSHRKQSAAAMEDAIARITSGRVSEEGGGTYLEMKSKSLPFPAERIDSPSSPWSHVQPRPRSTALDSPCSSKPLKAPKFSSRSPQLNRSSQSVSPPIKAVTLMRPRSGGDVPHVRNCAFKSANSSCRSSITENDVEQLPSHRERCIVADAEIITSPREYLKSLNKSCDFREEKRMESSPVVSALSDELKRALDRVQELERFRTSARKEVDCLLKRFSDERALLRAREQEKIQAAVFAIEEELEKERKLRKKLELENKKLSRNIAEANKAVMKAEKELEKERKARQLMEDVCDELAREIGEDKAEVEALKRDHAREREEMDEERRTLQMTEAWREERVQMKLLDAKYELEERCVALDKLKLELELYLSSRQVAEGEAYSDDGQGDGLRAAAEKLKADVSWSMLFLENGNSIAPQSEDDPVSSDDIHSLRLSRDNTRCHEWGGPSDVRVKERAKWAINYAREEPNALITTDKAVGNDARNIARKAYSEYNGSLFMTKPWAQTVGTTSELLGRPSGIANHENSEMEEDKEPIEGDVDDVATHDAGSQWRYTRQNGSDAVQDRHAQLAEEELGHIKASKADVKETETGRSKSRASSSPDSRNGLYKQVAPYQGEVLVHQNEGKHGFRKKHYEHARIESSRQKERDSKGVSPAAELSSLKQENDASAPSFMEQKVDWSDFPVYCNPLQGKRPTAAENAILHGRRDLAQWGKVSTSTQNLKTTPLLDDRGSRLQSRPKR